MPREYQFWEDDLEGLPKAGEDWRLYVRQMEAPQQPPPRMAAPPMEEPEASLPPVERFGDTPDRPPKIAYTWKPDPEDGLAAGRIEADEPDQILDSMRSLRERRQDHAAARPSVHDRDLQPSRLQKILNIVGNAAVGYVNAGGRTRPIAPIPLSRGKYDAAMERWENEGNTLEEEARAAMGEYTLRRQSDADARAARESNARMKETEAQAAERLARARHYDQPAVTKRQPLINTGRGVLDPETRRMIPGTEPKDKPAAPRQYRAESVLLDPDATPEQKAEAKRIREENRMRAGRQPQSTRAPQSTFAAIESRKAVELEQAESDFRKRLADASEDPNKVRADLELRKRQIQADYESQIEAAGGTVGRTGGVTPPTTPPARTPPQGQRRPLSSFERR